MDTYPIYNWGYNLLTKWDEPPIIKPLRLLSAPRRVRIQQHVVLQRVWTMTPLFASKDQYNVGQLTKSHSVGEHNSNNYGSLYANNIL